MQDHPFNTDSFTLDTILKNLNTFQIILWLAQIKVKCHFFGENHGENKTKIINNTTQVQDQITAVVIPGIATNLKTMHSLIEGVFTRK